MVRQSRHNQHWTGYIADAALLTAVVAAPLSVGGVPSWSQYGLLVVALLAFVMAAGHRRVLGRHLHFPFFAIVPLLLCASCALQLVPISPRLIHFLSENTFQLLDTSLTPLGAFSWHPLSLDPPATAIELGKLIAYVLIAVTAFQRIYTTRSSHLVLRCVAVSGLCVLLLSLVQTIGSIDMPYGVFGYKSNSLLVTSFVNPNHSGTFFGLTAFACMGVALSQRDRSKMALWSVAALALCTAVLLTLSRGAIVALLGTALVAMWIIYHHRKHHQVPSWGVLASMVLVLALALTLAYVPLTDELATLTPENLQLGKGRLWLESSLMIPRFLAVGIGRGAFARVFPAFKTSDAPWAFSHAENEVLQLVIDHGIVVGLCVVFAIAVLLKTAFKHARHASAIAVSCALLFVCLHNLVDFSLELTGVAVPTLLLGVVAIYRRDGWRKKNAEGQDSPKLTIWQRSWRLPVIPAIALALVFTSLGVYALYDGNSKSDQETYLIISKSHKSEQLIKIGAEALKRHPTDYIFALAIAQGELLSPTPQMPRALRWLNRATILNPSYAPSHRLTAQALWKLGARDQALSEWRRSIELDGVQTKGVFADVFALDAKYPEIALAVPLQSHMQLCQHLYAKARQEEAFACVERHLQMVPHDDTALWSGTLWYFSKKEYGRAGQLADELVANYPQDPRGYLWQGHVAKVQGETERALSIWQNGAVHTTWPRPLIDATFRLQIARGDIANARKTLEEYRRAPAANKYEHAGLHILTAALYQAQNLYARALREHEKARDILPENITILYGLAACQQKLGYKKRALNVYNKILQLYPEAKPAQNARRALQDEIMATSLPFSEQ